MSSINRDSNNRENWLKIQNEMNIFPYFTIKYSSIIKKNLKKFQYKIFPINETQLYVSQAEITVQLKIHSLTKNNVAKVENTNTFDTSEMR